MFLHVQAYERPTDLAAALQLLNRPGYRIVAGGTAAVGQVDADTTGLVDLGALGLQYCRMDPDGLTLGAMTTLAGMLRMPELLLAGGNLLDQAVQLTGAPTLLARATLGGALACPDRAPELVAALLALDARVLMVHLAGTELVHRELELDEYLSWRKTALAGALIEAVRISARPVLGAIERVARTPRDLAAVAVVATLQYDGAVLKRVRLVATGLAPVPVRLADAEAMLEQAVFDEAALERAAEKAQAAAAAAPSDLRGSAEYRRHLAGVLTRRALEAAVGSQGRM